MRVLFISSSSGFNDARTALRMEVTVRALLEAGWKVDVLSPGAPPILFPKGHGVDIFSVPKIPFSRCLPRRPSLRREIIRMMMYLHGAYLLSHNRYDVIHGIDDGAVVARSLDRSTIVRYRYIAELVEPFSLKGGKGCLWVPGAKRRERSAIRHASAVVLPDAAMISEFDREIPRARVNVIPDMDDDFNLAMFTAAETASAIRQTYKYVKVQDGCA